MAEFGFNLTPQQLEMLAWQAIPPNLSTTNMNIPQAPFAYNPTGFASSVYGGGSPGATPAGGISAFTPQQMQLLQGMMPKPPEQLRPPAGVNTAGASQVQIQPVRTQPLPPKPTLAQLLYGR